MICSNCGKEFDGNFCPYCGVKASAESKILSRNDDNITSEPTADAQNQLQQQIELQKEQLRVQQEQLAMQRSAEYKKMVCPRCHSNNVSVQAVAEQRKRGCLMTLVWIFLAVITVGIILLIIPLLMRKGSKTNTYAVCQSCGFRWRVR